MSDRDEALEMQRKLYPEGYLPAICIDIRMSLNGAADLWQRKDYQDAHNMLEKRLHTWCTVREDEFDRCVKRMIAITLDMLTKELSETKHANLVGLVKECEHWLSEFCDDASVDLRERILAELAKEEQ